MLLCVGVVACNPAQPIEEEQVIAPKDADVVEVLYFHGKQRCATCVAIERCTQELMNEQFADVIQAGTLLFRSVDIAEETALADKYEITWSSLVLVDYDNGQEEAENMTQFAFANARTNPEAFKEEVAKQITQMLND